VPSAAAGLEQAALVEAVGGFLPELDSVGNDADGAPIGRALDRLIGGLLAQALEVLAQRIDALNRLALAGDQRLQLVVARPAAEELFGKLPLPCPRSAPADRGSASRRPRLPAG
jgi:hypothetical protein